MTIHYSATAIPGVTAMRAVTARSYPRHTHDQYGIGVIDRGGHRSLSDRRHYEAAPGNLIFVNPGEVHDGHSLGRAPRAWRMLYLDPDVVADAVGGRSARRVGSLAIPHPTLVDRRFAQAFDRAFLALTRTAESPAEHEQQLLALLAHLADRASVAPVTVSRAMPDVRRAVELIEADPASSTLTLAALARASGTSRYQLIRGFVAAHALTPHAYIVQRRLAVARRLLARRDPVAEVACAAGFCDQSHLHRAFVRQFGVAPGAYRQACSGR